MGYVPGTIMYGKGRGKGKGKVSEHVPERWLLQAHQFSRRMLGAGAKVAEGGDTVYTRFD